jgi:hypothetical protein
MTKLLDTVARFIEQRRHAYIEAKPDAPIGIDRAALRPPGPDLSPSRPAAILP